MTGANAKIKRIMIGDKQVRPPYKYLTYTLDQTKSDPSQMVTTTSTLTQQQVMDFVGAYPVLLANDGTEYKKLNPNNFQQFADGTDASSYTASTSYDVMIKFPRRGYKISTSSNITTFTLTDNPNDSEYCYAPFQRLSSGTLGGNGAVYTNSSAFYIGAYLGSTTSNILRSWYGRSASSSATIGNFAGLARNHGNLRGIVEFLQYFYLQMCYLAIYKNTRAYTSIGKGYSGGSSAPTSGLSYNKGMYFGSTSATEPVKFAGIENRYGGMWQYLNGFGKSSSNVCYVSIPDTTGSNRTSSWSVSPTGSINVGTVSYTNWGQITKVMGTTYGGFTPKETGSGGSNSTYFCSASGINANNNTATFGGKWNDGDGVGAFYLSLSVAGTDSGASWGSRLMYLPNNDLSL